MVRNNLYTPFKRKCITYEGDGQPLKPHIYWLTYNLTPEDTEYLFYTDNTYAKYTGRSDTHPSWK